MHNPQNSYKNLLEPEAAINIQRIHRLIGIKIAITCHEVNHLKQNEVQQDKGYKN